MPDVQEYERIQFKMQRIRRHLDDDVDRIHADAAQLMDWKYYITRNPIVSLAAVSAAGFLLVPRARPAPENKVYLDPETSREVALKAGPVQVEQQTAGAEQGMLMTLGALAVNTLVKAGINYATEQVRQTWLKSPQNSPRSPFEEREIS